jgi:hypothetical protein
MPKLLYVKVVDLESSVSHAGLVTRFYRLEEESVMVRVLLPAIDMEETSDRHRSDPI